MRSLRSLALLMLGLAAGACGAPWSRQWKIFVVAHAHADVGYTELAPEVRRSWCLAVDQAMAAAARGFKWTLESSAIVDVYSRMRNPDRMAALVRLIRQGKIEVASIYTNLNQETAGPEELVRSTFYANEELLRKHGVVCKTAMLSDVPGATWGLPRVLAGAGTRYFLFGPGMYKMVHDLVRHPDLFYWKSPDGSKVLTRLGTDKYFFYGSGKMFEPGAATAREVDAMLRHYEALGDAYPYDAVMVQVSRDNGQPPVELVDIIRDWNARHANPQAIMATPSEFFEHVERQSGGRFPERSGDFTSAWTDMPGNFAEASGVKRKAASDVLAAEKFAVLAELLGAGLPYPQSRIAETYKDLLNYTEHTYGISTWSWEHDVLKQSGGVLHAPAWDFYKRSWETKKQYAFRAMDASSDLLQDALERLAARIATSGRTIVVFNSLSWERTDVVRVLSRLVKVNERGYGLVDAGTGETVPYQVLDGDSRYNTIAFLAKKVPALGYKTYRMTPATATRPAPGSIALPGNVLENEFYRVELDPETGGASSILDKTLGRELVDRKGKERVNQYLYYSLGGSHEALYNDNRREYPLGRVPTRDFKIAVHTPRAARVSVGHTGPVLTSLRSQMQMAEGPPTQIVQEVTLYPGIRRVDFTNRIRKQETLDKEEIYYSFPFELKDFEMHVELPGSVSRPYRDQLPGSFTGFSGVQHWADVSNREYGVAVATREAPAIECGEIRTNDWATEYQPKRSAFFFYVMNNRWNTNQALWQGNESWRMGFLELSFAVTSHRGDWRDGKVTRFGWEHNTPLVARVIEGVQSGDLPERGASFCTGLPDHVMLQTLKKAEDGRGYVARFYETEGRPGQVRWSGLPARPRQAYLTNLVEKNLRPARIVQDGIEFEIGPYQYITVRSIP